ncbi:hypothetical protein DPEC_G00353410 [Dallia pectoralis]|uniref:Uncharacterized protein n=1 Tax=Dallia pectoralis TaxID=75939 RepID=A0ACC2F2E0_DALPE|nr:hypothetical protein DPEC_G00353410 [Dallia pectoralis]
MTGALATPDWFAGPFVLIEPHADSLTLRSRGFGHPITRRQATQRLHGNRAGVHLACVHHLWCQRTCGLRGAETDERRVSHAVAPFHTSKRNKAENSTGHKAREQSMKSG